MSFSASKGGARIATSENFIADMEGDDMVSQTQNIGTTAELVDFGDLTGTGLVIIKNLDATNDVFIGSSAEMTGLNLIIRPGRFVLFEDTNTNLYAQADIAAVRILTLAVEL